MVVGGWMSDVVCTRATRIAVADFMRVASQGPKLLGEPGSFVLECPSPLFIPLVGRLDKA